MGDNRNKRFVRLADPCPNCHKYSYPTRAAARSARRTLPGTKKLNVYPCPHLPADASAKYFHLGHLPKNVIAGLIGREDIAASPRWTTALTETAA